jgi:hypothetical protein
VFLNASKQLRTLPPIIYEVVRLIPKITASNDCFDIAIRKQSDIIADICQGQTVTEETRKNLGAVTARYKMLQKNYASYMSFCLVYEKAQNHLLANAECLATTKNILWNAVVLFQCLWFIENGERFSLHNVQTDEKNILESNHDLGFTGYGVDDFMSKEKEESLSLFGLKGHSRWTIQACIFQMLNLYLN